MGNIYTMHIANERTERKNLRQLPNRLGHNGPYIGGFYESSTERDCQKIESHSELFRELEDFESDLEQAVLFQWRGMRELNLMIAGIEAGTEPIEHVFEDAVILLRFTNQYLQEALWIAEVLDDREQTRLKMRDRKDFLELISSRPRESMSGLDIMVEDGRLEWMISCLLDRRAKLHGKHDRFSMEWPKYDRAEWQDILARLETAAHGSIKVERLQDMSDEELAETLQNMEERARKIRKTITMVHAVRALRNG